MANNKTVLLLAALCFATWSVSMSAIASLQNSCTDDATLGGGSLANVEKFSAAVLSCNKVYR